MKVRLAAITLLTCGYVCGPATSALANWQWTKWGMTVDEVKKAAREPIRDATDEEIQKKSIGTRAKPLIEVAKLAAAYRANNYNFDAFFLFNVASNRLSCVLLELRDAQLAKAVLDDLEGKYGAPQVERIFSVTDYKWSEPDRITYTTMNGAASLTYCSNQDTGL